MKILEVLTYYRPHVSGLTIYVQRLSEALVRQGHEVMVLTSQYDPKLPREEVLNGVQIKRVPVAFRVSKGVIMPTFGWQATRLAWNADVLHLHLPQFDAPGLALRGKLFGKPVVLTYHCDLHLPAGIINRLIDQVVRALNRFAGNLADAVVTYTRDYGVNSPFLAKYLDKKLHIIPPPVELEDCPAGMRAEFRAQHQLNGHKVIGISARLAAEKGVEVLLNALPAVIQSHPNVCVLHAGPYKNIIGEEDYAAQLAPLLEEQQAHYHLLGTLNGPQLTAFYQNLDALVVCSLNSTESFGLVQIEAMMHGVPVVASNLPGVRQPVTMTGMGEVTPIGDAPALAQTLIRILDNKTGYIRTPQTIAEAFSPDQTAAEYMELFKKLMNKHGDRPTIEPVAYERLRAMGDAAHSASLTI